MNQRCLLVTMVIAGAVASGMAHAEGFKGFYVDVGAGSRSTTTALTESIPSIPLTDTLDVGNSVGIVSVAAGWNWHPDGGSILAIGIGVFANAGSTNAGESTTTAPGFTATAQITQDVRYGVSFEPGITFHQDTAVYLKLTASWAKFTVSAAANGFSTAEVSNTHAGFGYGAGIKHLVNKNVFIFAEFEEVDFQSKTEAFGVGDSLTVKPKNTQGVIGIGYQF